MSKDKPAVNDDPKEVEKPQENGSKRLNAEGNTEVRPPGNESPALRPLSEADKAMLISKTEKVSAELSLTELTDEKSVREKVQEGIKAMKEGRPVTFNLDVRVKLSSEDGKPSKNSQADILYDELKKANPENHFVFSKPDLKPGDKGYSEIHAPKVEQDGLRVSTKENPIKISSDIILKDGTKIPAGSEFAVGVIYDGKEVRSVDPNTKVWAVTPDGNYIQVAAEGQRQVIESSALHPNPKEKGFGQTASRTAEGGGAMHIINRDSSATSPDGKPLRDAYPSGGAGFEEAYKPGEKDGFVAAKAKKADHFKLPANVIIEAETAYGHATASGAKRDFFMRSGFADGLEPTAKNYTGETDMRSATELVKIRKELGLTEPTQVETGLSKAQGGAQVKDLLDKLNSKELLGSGSRLSEAQKAEFLSGKLVEPAKIAEWIKTGRIPAAELNEIISKTGGIDKVTADSVLDSLKSKLGNDASALQDKGARGLAESIIKQSKQAELEASKPRTGDMRPSGASLVALAAIAAGILAYAHPEETEALVKAAKSKLRELSSK